MIYRGTSLNKTKNKLLKYFIIGIIIVVALDLLGPYSYTFESYRGIWYFCMCSILFILGLKCKNLVIKTDRVRFLDNTTKTEYELNQNAINILFIVSIIAMVSSVIYIYSVFSSVGLTAFAQDDLRNIITDSRNNLSRFTEAFMHMAAPSYIMIALLGGTTGNNKKEIVIKVAYFFTPIAYLGVGARWSIYFYLLLFFFIQRITKSDKNIEKKPLSIKKIFAGIIFVIFLYIVLSTVVNLFQIRGLEPADRLFMFHRGDMTLRPFYKNIYDLNPTLFNPFYKILYYFGHSLPAFNQMYISYDANTPVMYGLYSFQIFQYFLIPFGYTTQYMKYVLSLFPMRGVYLTFVHGYMVDFGKIISPIMIFLTGVLFGKIEKSYKNNIYCKCLYPIIAAMVFNAAIYDMWTIAMINIDMFFIIVFIFVFKRIKCIDCKT